MNFEPAPSESDLAYAKAVAASIQPTEEVRFVAVDLVTRRHATGRLASTAADALSTDTPPERILAIPAGGNLVRLPAMRARAF